MKDNSDIQFANIEHCLVKDCKGEIYGLFVCEKHYKQMVRSPEQ